ncbi:MAG: CBS domain-containing protein [Alphaproteobacteria bacterium]|nr:CBS domain-containing protein [Alphaproteobacteria bacterium]
MTPDPVMISPEATLRDASKKMASIGCGVLPVGTKDHIQGMITDRDIVIRAIAHGKDPAEEKVAKYVTKPAYDCHEEDTLEDAAQIMHDHKVGRLLVRDRRGNISGILSFGTVLRRDASPREIADVVRHSAGPVSS